MNKKYFYILITIFLVIIFYFKSLIISNVLLVFNQTKQNISEYITHIHNNIKTHFNQAEQIKLLNKENQHYKNYIEKIKPILLSYKQLTKLQKIDTPNVVFTQTISYAKLPDMTMIYIDYIDKNLTTPKGLIYNNVTAGIVLKSFNKFSLASLNNNEQTSYTVFIGKEKIPGVLFGGNKVIIKYIPKYKKIKIGDKIITSGLDKIFYEGINVGIIQKIIQHPLYQEAIIQPFYNPLHPNFFYVISK